MGPSLDHANPVWQGLDADAAGRVAMLFKRQTFATGERLIRQGPQANAAFVIETGAVDIVREIPGGQTIPLNTFGPGAIIGELGLMADAPRLASAIAAEPVTASTLTVRAFQAALDSLDPAMLTVARNLLAIMAARLGEQKTRIADSAHPRILGAMKDAQPQPINIDAFDWRAFAPIMPAFAYFQSQEMQEFLNAMTAESLPKGAVFMASKTPVTRASFVIRGAAAAITEVGGAPYSLNVLGPGELCGASFLISPQPNPIAYMAKEALVVASMPVDAFRTMLLRNDPLGLALIRTTAWSLSRGFARSNNLLGNAARLARTKSQAA